MLATPMVPSANLLRITPALVAVAMGGCLSAQVRPACRSDRASEETAVTAAVVAFVDSTNLAPPIRIHGRWMISASTDADLGARTSERALLGAHGISDLSFYPLLSECLASLQESPHDRADLAVTGLPDRMERFATVVDTADPSDQCDASNTYPDDLFDAYLPDRDLSDRSTGPTGPPPPRSADIRTECWGAVTVSPPGFCGDHDDVALVILEISPAVPYAILRVPYKAAVLLWREDGKWVPRSVRAFGSADWSHE